MEKSQFSEKEQLIGAFRLRTQAHDGEEPSTSRGKRALLLLKPEDEDDEKIAPVSYKKAKPSEEKNDDFITRASSLPWSRQTQNTFFKEAGLVKDIGVYSEILVRVGLDQGSNSLKFFIRRENNNVNPSILMININDMREIKTYIAEGVKKIDEAMSTGQKAFQNLQLKFPDPQKSISFWEDDETFYANSLQFRCRWIFVRQNIYQLHLNHIKSNSFYPESVGPKICLCLEEAKRFFKAWADFSVQFPKLPEHLK